MFATVAATWLVVSFESLRTHGRCALVRGEKKNSEGAHIGFYTVLSGLCDIIVKFSFKINDN